MRYARSQILRRGSVIPAFIFGANALLGAISCALLSGCIFTHEVPESLSSDAGDATANNQDTGDPIPATPKERFLAQLPQTWATLYKRNAADRAGVAIFLTLERDGEASKGRADLGVYASTADWTINEEAAISLQAEWTDFLPLADSSVKLTPRMFSEGGPIILDAVIGAEGPGGVPLTFRPLIEFDQSTGVFPQGEWHIDSTEQKYAGVKLSASGRSYYLGCQNGLCFDVIKGRAQLFGCGDEVCWGLSETKYNIDEPCEEDERCFKKDEPAFGFGGEIEPDRSAVYVPYFKDDEIVVRKATRYQ